METGKTFAELDKFADLVKWIVREHNGGSYYAMAKALSVNPALIYAWRDGLVRCPRAKTLVRIADRYHLSRDWLLDLVSDRSDVAGKD